MSKYQSICQRFFVVLISIAIYSSHGAGGAGFDVPEAIASAMAAKKPMLCSACSKSFFRKDHLDRHMRVHTGERPYACIYGDCDKRFSEKSSLTVHSRIHTDERPYPCTECDKAFRQKSILTRHKRIHTGERPYICHKCRCAFSQKCILTKHMQTHPDCQSSSPAMHSEIFAEKELLGKYCPTKIERTAVEALLTLVKSEADSI